MCEEGQYYIFNIINVIVQQMSLYSSIIVKALLMYTVLHDQEYYDYFLILMIKLIIYQNNYFMYISSNLQLLH